MPALIRPIPEQAFSLNHGAPVKTRHHPSIKLLMYWKGWACSFRHWWN